MMCIALMSEPGVVSSQGKGKQKAGDARKWGKARLGQSVLFLELIALARRLGKDRKDDNSVSRFCLSYSNADGPHSDSITGAVACNQLLCRP
jgi:hypothetical protein